MAQVRVITLRGESRLRDRKHKARIVGGHGSKGVSGSPRRMDNVLFYKNCRLILISFCKKINLCAFDKTCRLPGLETIL